MSNVIGLDELVSELRSDIQSAVQTEVQLVCKKALFDHVNKTVYASGGGGDYSRTMEVASCVEVRDLKVSQSSVSFNIWINTNSMSVGPRQGNGFSPHQSFDGGDVRETLVYDWLEDGTSNRYYSHPGHGFMEKTETFLEPKIVQVLAAALRGRGWNAKVM